MGGYLRAHFWATGDFGFPFLGGASRAIGRAVHWFSGGFAILIWWLLGIFGVRVMRHIFLMLLGVVRCGMYMRG